MAGQPHRTAPLLRPNPKPLAIAIGGGLVLAAAFTAFNVAEARDKSTQIEREAKTVPLGSSPERAEAILGPADRLGITDDGQAWPSLGWVRPGRKQINIAFGPEGATRVVVIDWAAGGQRAQVSP